ncbi:hypothetical protein [Candidatus Methanodesulfokora washburnensis]|uniref:Uncharacterized protein n=1 Tax=Candidatus Methanodesulfokora washburnensis TaxID=2478471 RepID=A0A429GFU2_9CREN|nr:hypothetical protein [Candidatus Methanodesulfokores washburnensis]RSN72642.1 hypothetical protein D6D85_12990 [Candidatus Methanodesulfokores washburnensis]
MSEEIMEKQEKAIEKELKEKLKDLIDQEGIEKLLKDLFGVKDATVDLDFDTNEIIIHLYDVYFAQEDISTLGRILDITGWSVEIDNGDIMLEVRGYLRGDEE